MNARYLASRTRLAWRLARHGANRFGGTAPDYFIEFMREVWADYDGVLAYLSGTRPSGIIPALLVQVVIAAVLIAIGYMFPGHDFHIVFFGMFAQMAAALPFINRALNEESNNEYILVE